MSTIQYRGADLFIEDIAATTLAEQFSTPTFVYSQTQLQQNFHAFSTAFATHRHQLCYAVKANSNLSFLHTLNQLGAGFDIVSGGELERVLAAGGDPRKIIFSGVGKQTPELVRALKIGIHCFNIESAAELTMLSALATAQNITAPIAFRINPDVDAKTHPHISTGLKENKFGIPLQDSIELYKKARELPGIRIIGIACHIGSQLLSLTPLRDAISQLLNVINTLSDLGITLEHIDVGGGLGVRYDQEQPATPKQYGELILSLLESRTEQIIIAPGRALSANCGVLLTRVILLKHQQAQHFAVVDAAMNDMLRPALYSAFHTIIPATIDPSLPTYQYDIVGPVCESGDFLGKNRPLAIDNNSLLALTNAGAYGFSMSSQYNSRPRAAEVFVNNDIATLIRPRETIHDLFHSELEVATWL